MAVSKRRQHQRSKSRNRRKYRKVTPSPKKLVINPSSVIAFTKKAHAEKQKKIRLQKEAEAEKARRAAQRDRASRNPAASGEADEGEISGNTFQAPRVLEGLIVGIIVIAIFYLIFIVGPPSFRWFCSKIGVGVY